MQNSSIFPVTVIVAIILFVAREILESRRRHQANQRRLTAIKRMVADDVERNKWVVRSLRSRLDELSAHIPNGGRVFTTSDASGSLRVHVESQDDDGNFEEQGSGPLFSTARGAREKYIFDAAAIDQMLFAEMLRTLNALNELDHISRISASTRATSASKSPEASSTAGR